MKYLTTNKEQRQNNHLVIGFGYCQIQHIETYLTPTAYTTSRLYGWRADFYEFGGFTISTGYASLDFAMDARSKKQGEFIKQELKKLDKNLSLHKYTFQKGGDWHKGKKWIVEKINKIYQQSLDTELIK